LLVLTYYVLHIICIVHMSSTVRAFRRSLRALEREVELSLDAQTECCGVTSAQCHLLLEIDERENASIGELADALELDPSTLSRTADSLVRAGLVSRADDPSNRRRQILELLPAGRDKVAYINDRCDEYYEGVLAGAAVSGREALADAVSYLAEAIREKRLGGEASCRPETKGAMK
jgi:DNA-binding MarR family transcriptional regulator